MIRGYARVSTELQELGTQTELLKNAGCEEVYCDTISGKKRSRPQLDKLLSHLQPGDTVVITRLDRLGRSLLHLFQLLDQFNSKGVKFKSLADAIDTSTAQGKLMFSMLGAFAEFERNLMSERTKASLAYRKAIGIRLGRPPRITEEVKDKIKEDRKDGAKYAELISKYKISERALAYVLAN